MRKSTSMKMLALAASMLLSCTMGVQAKVTKPTSSGSMVISKVFYNGMKNDAGKAYLSASYIQLFNNSTDTLDIAGMFVGMVESHSSADQAWNLAAMEAEGKKDSVAIKQLYQIPTDKEYRVNPGQSIVITNAAFNHNSVAAVAPDLTNADFEVKSQNNLYKDYHNEAVPALVTIHTCTATMDFINFVTTGPGAIVLLAYNLDLTKCSDGFQHGKTSGNAIKFVPAYKIIDAVDVVANTKTATPSADQKRIPTNHDAGFTSQATQGGNNAEAIVRKTAFVTSAGRTVLYDTDNSSVDFMVTTDLAIRAYSSEAAGLSDSTIVIPESGYVAVDITKPFCGPKELVFSYVNVTNNAATTDLTYYTFPGDSLLLIKGPWIAIGNPGKYTIKLSESQGVMKTRSSGMTWSDEDTKTLSQTNRMIYKFQNTLGKIGFQRVPAVDGLYNTATFGADDRLYYAITEAIADKIAAANGANDHTDLDFIKWHGYFTQYLKDGIENVVLRPATAGSIFDLQGRRVNGTPQKGLYIIDGKKILVK